MDRFDTDVMEDLMYDAAEGPAQGAQAFDEWDGGDEFDGADEGDDEFIGGLLGTVGRAVGGLMGGGAAQGYDDFDEDGYDDFDSPTAGANAYDGYDDFDEYDSPAAGANAYDDGYDDYDALDDAVADAMDADGDEFFRRLGRIARGAVNVARRVGRGVGQVARVVGPIASMIPIPQAQMIGRIANVAGRLLADGADEFEAFDELVDGMDDDAIDAAAPVLAGIAIRRALPAIARAAAPIRRQAVRQVTQAIRTATRRAGAPGARAVARVVGQARRAVAQRRVAPRQVGAVVRRITQRVVARPQVLRRLARPLVPAARRVTPRGVAARVVARTVNPVARVVRRVATGGLGGLGGIGRVVGMAGAPRIGGCNCGARRMRFRGPVTVTIQGR